MPPQQNAQMVAAQKAAMIEAQNRAFMQQSLQKTAYCPVTGGSGTTATYAAGNTLYFDFPELGGAYITDLLITYNLTVTPATAGGATYALNAAAPFSMFSEIKIDYGNTQVRTHPFFLKIMDQIRGQLFSAQDAVIAGQADGLLTQQLNSVTPLVVNTGNVWQGKIRLRLNALADDSVPGVLPAMSVGNTPQLKLTCTPNFMGADPLMSVVNGTGGASPSVAVTGTINVDALYLDGSTMRSNIPLQLNLATEPTGQYYWESALTPFNSGLTWQRKQITTRLEHWIMASVIIDGNQSNTFMSNYANLLAFELGPDQSGQNLFKGWNAGNNVSIYDYYLMEVREQYRQDLDLGVIMWVDACTRGITNPTDRVGSQVLNMSPNGGFVATNHAYQVNTVSSATITPRVETFLYSVNYDGLKLVNA